MMTQMQERRAAGCRNPGGQSYKFRQKAQAAASVAVVAASQPLTAEASDDCQAGELPAMERAPATSITAAVERPGSRPATA